MPVVIHNIPVVQESSEPQRNLRTPRARPRALHFKPPTWHTAQEEGGDLPKYILHKSRYNLFFAPHLSKYIVTTLCHCPISSSSYFNGVALDLARVEWCYSRKAEFLLNVHTQTPCLRIQITKTFAVATAHAITAPGTPKRGPDTEQHPCLGNGLNYTLTIKYRFHGLSSLNNKLMMLKWN